MEPALYFAVAAVDVVVKHLRYPGLRYLEIEGNLGHYAGMRDDPPPFFFANFSPCHIEHSVLTSGALVNKMYL